MNVILTNSNTYVVKLKKETSFRATQGEETVANQFADLSDVDTSGVSDKYVVMYNATTQKYTMVNPDDVLLATITEPVSPGIPNDFVDELDVDLNNRINLDAGNF
jgi:hypothetical protein